MNGLTVLYALIILGLTIGALITVGLIADHRITHNQHSKTPGRGAG
ncbi:hypothetical protein ABZ069_34755 [Streptomyces microflavus]